MQIATEYLNTTVTNTFYNLVFFWNSSATGLPANAIVLDTTQELALAGDSEALVNKIADKLLGTAPSATLKAEAKAAADRVATTNAGQRVAEAMYLIVTSPDYVVQR
jgi:hypothetical protein